MVGRSLLSAGFRTLIGGFFVASGYLLTLTFALSTAAQQVRFDRGTSAINIPFELDRQIFVRTSVNGSEPLVFILDTGTSHSLIHLDRARALGLEVAQAGTVTDAAGSKQPDVFHVVDNVTLRFPGGVTVLNQSFAAISLSNLKRCYELEADGKTGFVGSSVRKSRPIHFRIDGILGTDFFKNFVVELNYSSKTLNLLDPASYIGRGISLPLEIDETFTFIRVSLGGRGSHPVPARLILDTGAGISLWLERDFAARNKLLPPVVKRSKFVECGTGGVATTPSEASRIRYVTIGKNKVMSPMTIFYDEPRIKGADGFLGNPALRALKRVVLDYRRSRMILPTDTAFPKKSR